MNAELVKQAMEKVGSAQILVNLISRRVRQLNAGGARPLIIADATLGFADIALLEIIEDKMGFEIPEIIELTRPTGRNRARPQGWGKLPAEKKAA